MLLAYNGIIPPTEWEHDKSIKNKYGQFTAYFFVKNNI